MAEVQRQADSVPESKVESKTEDKDALIVRLDELLEKYLHTLDEYQKSREQLSKQLSSVSYCDPPN
jgi:seryl-tRNA synthetase